MDGSIFTNLAGTLGSENEGAVRVESIECKDGGQSVQMSAHLYAGMQATRTQCIGVLAGDKAKRPR